jgi:hypothetical protein
MAGKKKRPSFRAFSFGVLRLSSYARLRYFFLVAPDFFAGAFFLAFAAGLATFLGAALRDAFLAGALFAAIGIVTSSIKVVGTPEQRTW